MSNPSVKEKSSRWSKLKRVLKKGAKILIPVAAGWAAGIIFPPAGAALYSFLKDKLVESPIPIPISDDKLREICTETIPKKSVEYLQRKLREALGEVKGITQEQLETVLDTFLRPLNDSLNEAMGYIKQFPDQISYLMEEWKEENRDLIKQLHLDMDTGFNEIKSSLSEQSSKIDDMLRTLSRFEDKLDKGFAKSAQRIFSSDIISNLDLQVISKAQLSMANYGSRFDVDFNADLYEPRKEADDAFIDFLRDLLSPFSSNKYLFLVLAGAGMGKTWTSAYWVNRMSEGKLDIEDAEKFVPFFISMKSGLNMQLRGYFNAPDKYSARINLRKAKVTSELTPILFFDGLDEIKPDEAKDTLGFVLELVKEEVPIVLTCRNTDWAREEKIIVMHSDLSNICFEHAAGQDYDIKGVSCQPSLHLGTFTDDELKKAIIKYQIPNDVIKNQELRVMAKHPVLLRLFSEYYKKYENLPDPGDPEDFKTIFLGERGAPPETNVLGRLGIIGKKRDYLVELTSRFLEKGDELKGSDLSDLTNQEENFKTVRSAGLIKEIWDPAYTAFALNELYKPHLEYMVELAGIKIKKPDSSKVIESPSVKKEIPANRKKYEYFVNMGKDYLESKVYQEALDSFQQAREVSKELYDLKLTKETENLIKQTENLIKKEQEAKEKATREAEEKAIKEAEERARKEAEEKAKKIVSFRGAQISQFEAEVLQELENITNQDFNLFDTINWDIKMGFTAENNRITGIGLYDCGLSTLPESIGNLKSLQELHLDHNQLTTLPESIGNLKSLQKLILSVNRLSTLPESIGNLSSLQTLYLYDNQLMTLPESIGNLKSLQELHLNHNQLTTLPESIGNLTSLQTLDLWFNQLTTLPESIGNLSSLEKLDLKWNQLSALPESIGNLSSLEKLDLYMNKLMTLPESIKILEKRGVTINK